MLNLDIIYLRDLKNHLPYSDPRSFRTWLSRFRVEIFGGKQTKRQYILKASLDRAILESRIIDLTKKFGKNWTSILEAEIELYTQYKKLLEVKEQAMPLITNKNVSKPFGEHGNKFLNSLSTLA